MPYTGRNLEEAYRKWQIDALPRITKLSDALGIPYDDKNKKWVESASNFGYWTKRGARACVDFGNMRTEKIQRELGEPRPVGEQKNELAVVDQAGPNDFDSEETLSWTRGKNEELTDTSSQTHGWSVTVTSGFEIGGEASGGKIIGGLELGASGEYSNEKAEANGDSWETSHSTTIQLPKGQVARIVQTIRTGEIEIDVTDLIVLELGWKVKDWKHRENNNLDGHAGEQSGGKTRQHWHLTSAYDLLTLGDGTNPRYPKSRGWSFAKWKHVKPHFDWLMDEDNRTILVESQRLRSNRVCSAIVGYRRLILLARY